MEDGIAEAESLLSPKNLRSRGAGEEKDHEQEEGKKGEAQGGREEKAGGFINHLISNLVSKEDEEHDKEKREIVSEGKDEEKGGLINHLISNLVSPRSPKARVHGGKVEVFEVGDGERSKSEENVGGGGNSGGLINDLVSNLLHQGEGGGGDNKEEKVQVVEESEQAKTEKEGGGGGIIDILVSHLPTSLPDDAAPTADEATILIHSIIHD